MLRILSFALALMLSLSCCDKSNNESSEIYFFYSDHCPHCHEAIETIERKYPDLKLTRVSVDEAKGRTLLFRYAEMFKIGNRIGTPFFVFKDKYIMGWSPQQEKLFDIYIKSLTEKQ